MAQSDVMCSFTRPKGTSQGEAVITHEVRITFRASGTHRSKNEKAVHRTAFVFGCGGGTWTSRPPGYEPDELPTALPRDIKLAMKENSWCRWPGSNRYGMLVPWDFKSHASACSATPAYSLSFKRSYSISRIFAFVNTFLQNFENIVPWRISKDNQWVCPWPLFWIIYCIIFDDVENIPFLCELLVIFGVWICHKDSIC